MKNHFSAALQCCGLCVFTAVPTTRSRQEDHKCLSPSASSAKTLLHTPLSSSHTHTLIQPPKHTLLPQTTRLQHTQHTLLITHTHTLPYNTHTPIHHTSILHNTLQVCHTHVMFT